MPRPQRRLQSVPLTVGKLPDNEGVELRQKTHDVNGLLEPRYPDGVVAGVFEGIRHPREQAISVFHDEQCWPGPNVHALPLLVAPLSGNPFHRAPDLHIGVNRGGAAIDEDSIM